MSKQGSLKSGLAAVFLFIKLDMHWPGEGTRVSVVFFTHIYFTKLTTFSWSLIGKSSLEYAIEALTKDLQNGDYLRQTSPRDFDAEGYFAGFQDQRRARSIWSSTVIPRLISSSHGELRKVGLTLQKKWASKSYRKHLDKARAQAEVVLDSIHKHQTRILDHSYKDLCHTLQRREGIAFFCS